MKFTKEELAEEYKDMVGQVASIDFKVVSVDVTYEKEIELTLKPYTTTETGVTYIDTPRGKNDKIVRMQVNEYEELEVRINVGEGEGFEPYDTMNKVYDPDTGERSSASEMTDSTPNGNDPK